MKDEGTEKISINPDKKDNIFHTFTYLHKNHITRETTHACKHDTIGVWMPNLITFNLYLSRFWAQLTTVLTIEIRSNFS